MYDYQPAQSTTMTHYGLNEASVRSTHAPVENYRRLFELERHGSETLRKISIDRIEGKRLAVPLTAKVTYEDGEYIAEMERLPLYGVGASVEEALEHLQYEVDTLYTDLMENDDFSSEFLGYKDFFQKNVLSK
jgi:predicted RNase H-like HicB family nuclease